ncbi:MAG: ABC transporter ATP-binding protein [Bacilli bacterium]|nr:ABC transporter ATP-binding protein [Bacilli bacterium]
MIKIKNLIFEYNANQPIIDNISFELKPGKIYVLLGLNGCGKTTLIKLLVGLLNLKSGTIEYYGNPIERIPYNERANFFSYVSQSSSNIYDYIVRDYLSFSLVGNMKFYNHPKEFEMKKVQEYASKFGIEKFLNKKLGELSGGERQLISICGAFIQSSKVILMDEPTSALDLKNQNIVLSKLLQIAEEEKKTIIFSTHNPNHALFLDATVFLMKNGKIIDYGISKKIITKGKLSQIYGEEICYSEEMSYKEISFKRKK